MSIAAVFNWRARGKRKTEGKNLYLKLNLNIRKKFELESMSVFWGSVISSVGSVMLQV